VRRLALALLVAALPAAGYAQIAPTPGWDDPRVQTVAYDPAQPVRLVAFPGASLTVILLQGDRIERAVMSDRGAFEVRVTGAGDSLNIVPLRANAAATLVVDTPVRRYEFDLDTGEGLAAAYLVRFVGAEAAGQPAPSGFDSTLAYEPQPIIGAYRVSGERGLRPDTIGDDGYRTYIEWGEHQPLPAVFGIGPTGTEEVVDGYMREGVFTIDRIYGELVFRIDRKRARARRGGGAGGR
jgi:type IV secretion system protein VirB9